MGPPPVVTGISPKEATAGIKITIRGENLGTTPNDVIGVNILGKNHVKILHFLNLVFRIAEYNIVLRL